MFPLGSFQLYNPILYALGTGGDPIPLITKSYLPIMYGAIYFISFFPYNTLLYLVIVVPLKMCSRKKFFLTMVYQVSLSNFLLTGGMVL